VNAARLLLAGAATLAAGLALALGAATARSSARMAAQCVPAILDASDRLPGTPLLVTPAPGGLDAMPQTQLSFLGAPVRELSRLVVRGSLSGEHRGRLLAYSQRDGGSFLPDTPFHVGERVTVRGILTARGVARRFAYSFTIGDPDPIGRLPTPNEPQGPPGSVSHFRSAPGLEPATLTVTTTSAAAQRGGDIFLATYPGPGEAGPTIYAPNGALVWFKPLPAQTFATDVKVQRYDGQPVLTWWQGTISAHGFGLGEGEIYSRSYRPLATVRAGDGLAADLHEFVLEPDGVALITAWKPLYCNLAADGGASFSAVYDAVYQQIDVHTGLVMYEWDSLEHVPLSDSYEPVSGANTRWPYDWFHLNAISPQSNGDILISARATWAVYDLDPASGQIVWQAGGRRSSLTMGPGTTTAWQHDVQALGADTYSVFDNGGAPSAQADSQGMVVRVDGAANTATLLATFSDPTPIYAETQGDLQRLDDGDWWIGWGNVNESSELSPRGTLLYAAHTPVGSQSYRSLRFPWRGRPTTRPSIALARRSHRGLDVYASWNGATAVARWRVEAGRTPGALHAVRSAARSGFETEMTAPAARFIAVVALDTRGRVLGSSRVLPGPR
jgi:hypothetical protein